MYPSMRLFEVWHKNFSQRWTKVVETKLENLVNSKNDLIFQILSSPPYAAISMLSLTKFS